MPIYNMSVEKVDDRNYIVRGIIDGRFVTRTFIGYTKEQAVEKFTAELQKGETNG